jgi:four helix bundle protein
MGGTSYRELKVWRLGMEVARKVYVLTGSFPKSEVYGLSSQLQRAAVSVPANIAEGRAKDTTKEFLRHVSIAHGSLAELETHLLLAQSLHYCDKGPVTELLRKCAEEGRMLNGLRKTLKAKLSPLTPDP